MINKYIKILIVYFFTMSIFLSTTSTLTATNPHIEITLNPKNPAPKSVVTFSVDINENSISTVRLIIRECNKETGLCHMPQNISMSKVDDDTYNADVQLEYDNVNSLTYKIAIQNEGKWIEYKEYTTALTTKSDKNQNDSNGAPGFEIISLFLAIIGLLIFKRCKSK